MYTKRLFTPLSKSFFFFFPINDLEISGTVQQSAHPIVSAGKLFRRHCSMKVALISFCTELLGVNGLDRCKMDAQSVNKAKKKKGLGFQNRPPSLCMHSVWGGGVSLQSVDMAFQYKFHCVPSVTEPG